MVSLLLLASISRCVSADLCPTNAEITAAVLERDAQAVSELSAQLEEEDPTSIHLVHSERIRDVRDVICGNALPGDLPTITCRFTVRYWTRNSYQVARLVKEADGWRIDQALMVTRDRN